MNIEYIYDGIQLIDIGLGVFNVVYFNMFLMLMIFLNKVTKSF